MQIPKITMISEKIIMSSRKPPVVMPAIKPFLFSMHLVFFVRVTRMLMAVIFLVIIWVMFVEVWLKIAVVALSTSL